MSTPASKKRRLDTANATLRRPFTSPIIKRPKATEDPAISKAPHPLSSKAQNSRQIIEALDEKIHDSLDDSPIASPQKAHKTHNSPKLKSPVLSHTENPLLSLVAQHKKEQIQRLKQLDQELEMVRQAQRIVSQSKSKRPGEPVDQELRDLIGKWQSGSRQAAEELFVIVKERVSNAGGIKAWKEMQQKQKQFYQGFDEAPMPRPQMGSRDENAEIPGSDDEPDDNSLASSEMHPSTQESLEEADEINYDKLADIAGFKNAESVSAC
ncbi:putative dna repair protein dds20 mei5 protein [Phaeoacremonium minimum UCRPA7]|uniref:Putative dna repair protein dds20 mei5 protein n=1 Tax=Phaeoacremonium minimum (strain UCR-PA7) TaxID=1286976 RepID=R8BNM8_PHAM7|nr:putative dna repair protein dds20 mei5 protein [Phaeoacremonium minimum UCRPA7]EOO00875.1 putative dna repair protein dds20 mei5 protein [Phaeoacremonium minimum UCRPA7]